MEEVAKKSVEKLLQENQDIALAQLTVLMRIYDIQTAILTNMNPDRANAVYEKHENGGSYSPPIYFVGESEIPDEGNAQTP